MLTIENYEPSDLSLWHGRPDSLPGERFFQQVLVEDVRITSSPTYQQTVIAGFCCDKGIERNLGHVGAKKAPHALREQLAKLACHTTRPFIDAGNIVCEDDLAFAQEQLAILIDFYHQRQCKTIIFGGGHEMAWGHFLGLTRIHPKLGIINFDAHFDLRPLPKDNVGTSGTPFAQIQHYCMENKRPFHYCCLGIQPEANTRSLFQRANLFNVDYLTAEEINQSSQMSQMDFIDQFIQKNDEIYLSICLDVFAECFAPGVSAPQALGLSPWQVLPLLKYIMQTGKVVSVDIAELSPPLDETNKTARLAAMLVAALLEFN